VAAALGEEGEGSLTLVGARGPVVVPARWRVQDGTVYAALPAATLGLAGADADAPAALTIDRVAEWRAKDMVGALLQGTGSSFVQGEVGSGAKSMLALAHAIAPGAGALVRLRPRRVVWWKGWSSGSRRLA
jgi:hypothetical protein